MLCVIAAAAAGQCLHLNKTYVTLQRPSAHNHDLFKMIYVMYIVCVVGLVALWHLLCKRNVGKHVIKYLINTIGHCYKFLKMYIFIKIFSSSEEKSHRNLIELSTFLLNN